MPELKPTLWLELDESAVGVSVPPEMWWAVYSYNIHHSKPANSGGNPVFPLVAIPADQVLVPRGLMERIAAYTETLYDREQRAKALEELRTLLHP